MRVSRPQAQQAQSNRTGSPLPAERTDEAPQLTEEDSITQVAPVAGRSWMAPLIVAVVLTTLMVGAIVLMLGLTAVVALAL